MRNEAYFTAIKKIKGDVKIKYSVEILKTTAQSKGGLCLSEKYINQNVKLNWQCQLGHQWEASPTSIIHSNSWCPVCAGNQRLTILTAQTIANKRGGKCLSAQYHNSKSKLLWQCKRGHQWYASLFSIKNRNSWCPECYQLKS